MSRLSFAVTVVLSLLVLVVMAGIVAESATPTIKWEQNYNAGVAAALKAKKPIMVDFYTDWCGWCKKLDKSTYTDSRVVALSSSFVCIKVDGDRYPDLVKKFKVTGYPTIVFFNSKSSEISRAVGYKDADGLLAMMKDALKKAK